MLWLEILIVVASFLLVFVGAYGMSKKSSVPERVETGNVDMKKEDGPRKGVSGFGVFVAVVFGILVAFWIASKIFHIEIFGTITPMK